MKTAAGLAAFLALFSVNSWAQEFDYDKRNAHIFCAAHLSVLGDSLDEKGDQYQALAYLSDMHRDKARMLGATPKHFGDVAEYLKEVRNNDKQKWKSLSSQSERVCLPGS